MIMKNKELNIRNKYGITTKKQQFIIVITASFFLVVKTFPKGYHISKYTISVESAS